METVCVSTVDLQDAIDSQIPREGCSITIARLTEKLTNSGHFHFPKQLTSSANENLVRRALEFTAYVLDKHRQREKASVPVFLEVEVLTGKVLTKRPKGVRAILQEIMFEPDWNKPMEGQS